MDDGIRLDYFNPEDAKDAFAGAMSKVFLILASVFAEIEGQRFVQRAQHLLSLGVVVKSLARAGWVVHDLKSERRQPITPSVGVAEKGVAVSGCTISPIGS